jgi:hypothetical protein
MAVTVSRVFITLSCVCVAICLVAGQADFAARSGSARFRFNLGSRGVINNTHDDSIALRYPVTLETARIES